MADSIEATVFQYHEIGSTTPAELKPADASKSPWRVLSIICQYVIPIIHNSLIVNEVGNN